MEILNHTPEVPVNEEWEWRSDILVSYNGEEQRISLRGANPRCTLNLNLRMVESADILRLWSRLLKARNQVWVPEYHLATLANAESASATDRLYFTKTSTDIRVGEKVLVGSAIYEIDALETDGASLTTNLSETLPKGGLIVPIAEATLENPTLARPAVDNVGMIRLNVLLKRPRANLVRPEVSDPLTYWDTVPVLDVRPLANDETQTSLLDNQITIDNNISNIRLVNRWSQPKEKNTRAYLVDRVVNGSCSGMRRHLDYWRFFFEYCRGSNRKFWLPTFRKDLTLVGTLDDEATTIIVSTLDYATNIFPNQDSHKYLEVETEQGVHRCEITAIASEGSDTELTVTPAFPTGWVNVVRISYLIPSRLDGDSISWQHYGTHTFLNLSFVSAENE